MNEEPVEVVAIGPHPDDAELGIGGTLAKLANSGIRTDIIDLTKAKPTPKNEKFSISFSSIKIGSGIVIGLIINTKLINV